MTGNDILYLVIPCYNEEAVLPETAKRLLEKMNSMLERNMIAKESRIMLSWQTPPSWYLPRMSRETVRNYRWEADILRPSQALHGFWKR